VDISSGQLGEYCGSETDWSGSGYKHEIARSDTGTGDRMGANGKEFNHGGLLGRQARRRIKILFWNGYSGAHSAVPMDSKNLDVRAAIGISASAGPASSAR
jgi:hypothetical protein